MHQKEFNEVIPCQKYNKIHQQKCSVKTAMLVALGEKVTFEIYRVDNKHKGELTKITDNSYFYLELLSIVLIKKS